MKIYPYFLHVKNVISNYQVTTVNLQARALLQGAVSQLPSHSAQLPVCSAPSAVCPGNIPAAQFTLCPITLGAVFCATVTTTEELRWNIRHLHPQQHFSQELSNTPICIRRKRTFGTKGESSVLHQQPSSQVLVHRSMLPPWIPCIFNV